MDNDSSPVRTNKRRKSDETERNDNHSEPSTSFHSQNNNANSSSVVIIDTSDEDKQIGDSGIGIEENAGPAELEEDANGAQPTADRGESDVDDDTHANAASEGQFRSRSRRSTGRQRNYRNRMMTTSSSSSSSGSLEGVVIRGVGQSQSGSEPGSSDSNVHTSAPEFELDSSASSDSMPEYSEEEPSSNDGEEAAYDGDENAFNEVKNKVKPAYSFVSAFEIMRREHGLSGDGRHSLRNGNTTGFQTRFYGSRHVVEKMKLMHSMHKHIGCVNCLNFNRAGNLLCTGSDDMKVIVWDWAANNPKFSYKSGHTENIFQSKFVELNGCMDIVSTSRDGQVRAATIPPSGGKIRTRALYKHTGAVHKLVLCPQNPYVFLSAGEDGKIISYDLRKSSVNPLKTVKEEKRKIPLYSIAHHPFADEICVCGNDNNLRVYDKRNFSKPLHKLCPQRLMETIIPHITCCVYSSTGAEILASYSDDDIYLFNHEAYICGQYTHRYRGHYNNKTIKGVNFFGPNSEYVISGSDCGNIFFWDKKTEAIINFMEGDNSGVVNCLEPHPTLPILATSGLDHNIKIWAPLSETYPPAMPKLDKCVKKNLKRSVGEEVDGFDDRQFYYFVRQFLRNSRPSDHNDSSQNDLEVQLSNSSTSDTDEEYRFSNDQIARALRPSCNPQ